MKLIYFKPALKCDSFDVAIGIKIPFFRVLVTIEPGRSLLQFVTTNCLISANILATKPKIYVEGLFSLLFFHGGNCFGKWTAHLLFVIHIKTIKRNDAATFIKFCYFKFWPRHRSSTSTKDDTALATTLQ